MATRRPAILKEADELQTSFFRMTKKLARITYSLLAELI
jgi:hypothetical protein